MPTPQGEYRPAVIHDNIAYTAGITPRVDGKLTFTGLVGTDVSVSDATAAAHLAAGDALIAVRLSLPDGARIDRCLRMTVYIASAPGFLQHSEVADGASRRLREDLGVDTGTAARSAVGVASLPGNAPVEVELTVGLRRTDT
ncbi:MAG TPA: RidA family protein [Jatrophihabitantaceae bacterium]|jgi:enamine deaminase RidA (YjgF/YER057c/UK114 family)